MKSTIYAKIQSLVIQYKNVVGCRFFQNNLIWVSTTYLIKNENFFLFPQVGLLWRAARESRINVWPARPWQEVQALQDLLSLLTTLGVCRILCENVPPPLCNMDLRT